MTKKLFIMLFLLIVATFNTFAADASNAYKLNQGDVLNISVWGEESLQKEVRVLPDGSITFPLAGRVEVANQTTPEVEKRITEKLKTYLPDPQVTVVISNIEGNRAYIIGKVVKPGPILLVGPMTVMQALSLAGGLDKFADLDSIKVLRGTGTNQTLHAVNYNRLIKGQALESNILLNTGDTILVP
jgi:polysaccharide biosynthesis/export protein